MHIDELTVHAPDGKFYLVQGPDLHVDLRAFQAGEFNKWRKKLLSMHERHPVVLIMHGDYVHGRVPGDTFFNPEVMEPHFL